MMNRKLILKHKKYYISREGDGNMIIIVDDSKKWGAKKLKYTKMIKCIGIGIKYHKVNSIPYKQSPKFYDVKDIDEIVFNKEMNTFWSQ